MGIACRIERKEGRIEQVYAPNGNPSLLYEEALEKLGNREDALQVMATAYTPGFISYYGNWENPKPEDMYDLDANGEPRLSDVMKYLQKESCVIGNLMPEDITSINNLRSNSGMSFNELLNRVRYAFFKTGRMVFNTNTVDFSGIFKTGDSFAMDTIFGGEGSLLEVTAKNFERLADFSNTNLDPELVSHYFPTIERNRYGIYEGNWDPRFGEEMIIPQGAVDMYVGEEAGNSESGVYFYNNVEVDMWFKNENIAESMQMFKELRDKAFEDYVDVPVPHDAMIAKDDVVDRVYPHTYNFMNFARLDPVYGEEFRKTMYDFLLLEDMPMNEREGFMKKLESLGAKNGIDFVGISNEGLWSDFAKMQDVVSEMYDIFGGLRTGTDKSQEFGLFRYLYLRDKDVRYKPWVKKIGDKTLYNLVTSISDPEMYRRHHMLRVAPNTYIYGYITGGSIEETYDKIEKTWDEFSKGKPIISGFLGPNNAAKVKVLKDYVSFLSDSNNTEEMVLARIIAGAPAKPEPYNVDYDYEFRKYMDGVDNLDLDTNYLYHAYLDAKVENGKLWQKVYRYIGFEQDGTPYMKTDDPECLVSVEVSAPKRTLDILKSFSKVGNDPTLSTMFYYKPSQSPRGEDFYDFLYKVHPDILPEYKGTVTEVDSDTVSAEGTFQNYIKIGNRVYSKVGETESGSVYRSKYGPSSEVKFAYTQTLKEYASDANPNPVEYVRDVLPIGKAEMERLSERLECRG